MKHVQLFEQFLNEAKYSSSEMKKLKKFAEEISDEILNFPDLKDKFYGPTSTVDKEDYSPENMLDYLLKWGSGKSANDIIKHYDWEGDWDNLNLPE
jgi:hypothetical protein